MSRENIPLSSFVTLLAFSLKISAASPSPLFLRGYTVIPQRRQVDLRAREFQKLADTITCFYSTAFKITALIAC